MRLLTCAPKQRFRFRCSADRQFFSELSSHNAENPQSAIFISLKKLLQEGHDGEREISLTEQIRCALLDEPSLRDLLEVPLERVFGAMEASPDDALKQTNKLLRARLDLVTRSTRALLGWVETQQTVGAWGASATPEQLAVAVKKVDEFLAPLRKEGEHTAAEHKWMAQFLAQLAPRTRCGGWLRAVAQRLNG